MIFSDGDNKDREKLLNLLMTKRKQNTEETNDNPKDSLKNITFRK